MSSILNILPALAFLLILLSISAYIQRTSKENRQKDFAKDYFIGGRTLGGFVLAMTTAATYSSVSTFVGGPGVAWVIGYGWLYMAIVQVVVIFLVLGVFGKKIALIGGGPASLTVARDLAPLGYTIHLYDEQWRGGGMMRSQIPAFRLPESVLNEEVGYILDMGIHTHFNTYVSSLNNLL